MTTGDRSPRNYHQGLNYFTGKGRAPAPTRPSAVRAQQVETATSRPSPSHASPVILFAGGAPLCAGGPNACWSCAAVSEYVPSGICILVCAVGAGAPPAAAASNSAPAGEPSRRVCSAARPAASYLVLQLLAHHMKRVIRSDQTEMPPLLLRVHRRARAVLHPLVIAEVEPAALGLRPEKSPSVPHATLQVQPSTIIRSE